jgi:hypothetical protein
MRMPGLNVSFWPLETISGPIQMAEQQITIRGMNDMRKKDEKTLESVFDARSASSFQARVAGTPHHAYKDATGNICLVCAGSSPGGGVAVNENALNWLREQPGPHFVRLTNSMNGFDKTVLLDHLPQKQMRDGHYGRYVFFDTKDFGAAPPFPEPAGEPRL